MSWERFVNRPRNSSHGHGVWLNGKGKNGNWAFLSLSVGFLARFNVPNPARVSLLFDKERNAIGLQIVETGGYVVRYTGKSSTSKTAVIHCSAFCKQFDLMSNYYQCEDPFLEEGIIVCPLVLVDR